MRDEKKVILEKIAHNTVSSVLDSDATVQRAMSSRQNLISLINRSMSSLIYANVAKESYKQLNDLVKNIDFFEKNEVLKVSMTQCVAQALKTCLVEKFIHSYGATVVGASWQIPVSEMKRHCQEFSNLVSGKQEDIGLLFEIALFKSAVAQFRLETTPEIAQCSVRKKIEERECRSPRSERKSGILFSLEQKSSLFLTGAEAAIAKLKTENEILKLVDNIEKILKQTLMDSNVKKEKIATLFEAIKVDDARLVRIFQAYRIFDHDGKLNAELFQEVTKTAGFRLGM